MDETKLGSSLALLSAISFAFAGVFYKMITTMFFSQILLYRLVLTTSILLPILYLRREPLFGDFQQNMWLTLSVLCQSATLPLRFYTVLLIPYADVYTLSLGLIMVITLVIGRAWLGETCGIFEIAICTVTLAGLVLVMDPFKLQPIHTKYDPRFEEPPENKSLIPVELFEAEEPARLSLNFTNTSGIFSPANDVVDTDNDIRMRVGFFISPTLSKPVEKASPFDYKVNETFIADPSLPITKRSLEASNSTFDVEEEIEDDRERERQIFNKLLVCVLALADSTLCAGTVLFARKITNVHFSVSTTHLMFWTFVLCITITGISGQFALPADSMQCILILAFSFCGTIHHFTLYGAVMYIEAGMVSTIRNIEIPISYILQAGFLATVPSISTSVGATIIAVSTITFGIHRWLRSRREYEDISSNNSEKSDNAEERSLREHSLD